MDSIKNKFKKYINKNNFNMFFYLLGSTSNFLICEIIKNFYFFQNENKSNKYHYCINILKKDIIMKDTIKICEILNNKENFQTFIYNLFYTWLIIYILMREVINKNKFCLKYWITTHLSSIIFTIIDQIKIFQFSFTNDSDYNQTRKNIIYAVFFVLLIPSLINIFYKKVKITLIINFLSIYSILYLILLTVTSNITIHLHHVLVCGFCSLFFTNFKNKINYYTHAILIGIIIQGINFYSTTELMMFYINDIEAPSPQYLFKLYFILSSPSLIYYILKKYYNRKKYREVENNTITIQLMPSLNELNEFNNIP